MRAGGEVVHRGRLKSPTRPDNHREEGYTLPGMTNRLRLPPAHNKHYAFLVVPGHGLLVTRLTGWLTPKLEGYEN